LEIAYVPLDSLLLSLPQGATVQLNVALVAQEMMPYQPDQPESQARQELSVHQSQTTALHSVPADHQNQTTALHSVPADHQNQTMALHSHQGRLSLLWEPGEQQAGTGLAEKGKGIEIVAEMG
jgi:hypothetical protein